MRKDFFRGLCLLTTVGLITACGGGDDDYADRMATEHEGDRPVASGAASVEPTGEIEERVVEYATVGGKPVTGFLARPSDAGPGAPAIIVIQEWWGLNDNIRSMARRLAGEGYVALAVDLYEGNVADTPERARELMMASMEREDALEDNLRQAYTYLDAAVIYYGRSITDRDRLATLQVPILGIFGAEDQGIPVDGVREFESVLKDLGKDAEIHVYDGADHAFANPSGTRYHAEAAEDAWARTLDFLKINLGS